MIVVVSDPGEAWYAQIWINGMVWNGSALVAYNAANWATYAIALTDANGIGVYTAAVPAGLPAGVYWVSGYKRTSGEPAAADAPPQRQGELVWDGSAEVTAADAVTAAEAIPTAILQTPANKIKTNASGQVETSNPSSETGNGDTEVDHNTGGTDNLRYATSGGVGIDNAEVVAYLASEYAAGIYTRRGRTVTDSEGKWVTPLMLNSGLVYAIKFEKPGAYGPDTKNVTVP